MAETAYFKGYVNPEQNTGVRVGRKTILPGHPIELSKEEYNHLKAKGAHNTLLVKSLPKKSGGEPPEPKGESKNEGGANK